MCTVYFILLIICGLLVQSEGKSRRRSTPCSRQNRFLPPTLPGPLLDIICAYCKRENHNQCIQKFDCYSSRRTGRSTAVSRRSRGENPSPVCPRRYRFIPPTLPSPLLNMICAYCTRANHIRCLKMFHCYKRRWRRIQLTSR